tara:strand:+ start:727 stop:927 length:201 start_codon:yes stop_codon:yes gene_type:complete
MKTIKQDKMKTTTKYNHLFTEEKILRTCIKLNMRDLANAEIGSKEFHALAKLVANGRKKLKELSKS